MYDRYSYHYYSYYNRSSGSISTRGTASRMFSLPMLFFSPLLRFQPVKLSNSFIGAARPARTKPRFRFYSSLSHMVNSLQTSSYDTRPSLPSRRTFYPGIQPYHTAFLQVSKIHSVYYEISGNKNGLPVCFVHGGPGGGTEPTHRTFFDPAVYKIVLFDQRGCGKSTPFACVEENTTWDLIADMEAIREAANIHSWILFGGSWGSTLSLAYAQQYPHRVIAMILRGVFLLRKRELDWLYQRNGAAMLYPEAFDSYLTGLPEEVRTSNDLIHAFNQLLSEEQNSEERRVAANAWSNWEHTLSSFPRPGAPVQARHHYGDDENLAFARIEAHYFANRGFFKEDAYLLKESQIRKIRHIKIRIVQGRWDVVCPRKSAYDLAQVLDPDRTDVVLVDNAGHSTFEPGIADALLNASDLLGAEFGSSHANR